MTEKRLPSFFLILLAYALAFLAAFFVARLTETAYGAFTAGLIADLAATLIIFAFSMMYRNSSAYDPYWSVAPPVLYIYWAVWSGALGDPRTSLLLAVTLFWALRLTSNWMRDWPGLGHEDWRYVEFREKYGRAYPAVSLGGVHVFPTVIVALASLPAWFIMQNQGGQIAVWEILGLVVSGGGAFLCFIADEQMRRYRASGRKEIMASGLWGISRHPNYLGEIMFWYGIWFMAIGASSSLWWTGIGAFAMLAMFLFVSAPWMERKLLRSRPGYTAVMASVPILIPIPGRSMSTESESRSSREESAD